MLKLMEAVVLFVIGYSLIPTLIYQISFHRKHLQEDKAIFLTFDDGPSRMYTEQLLDVLKKYKIKATFFIVAGFGAANPDIIKRMKEEGHLIGIHSAGHKSALLRGPLFMRKDFHSSMKLMESLCCQAHFYRPPWGHLNLITLYYIRKYHLQLVLWDVMAQDWKASATVPEIEEKLLRRVRGGSIICLHDGRGAKGAPGRTIAALDKSIPLLLKKGYHFSPLTECGEKYE